MLKLLWMEDPVKGVSSLEFIGPCHIDADIILMSAESGPYSSSTLAKRNGWPLTFSQQLRPAKRVVDYLDW
jgi:hypothetical protein